MSTNSVRLDPTDIERWKKYLQQLQADRPSIKQLRETSPHRNEVRLQMLDLGTAFLNGTVSLEKFRLTFHTNTMRIWDTYGVGGAAGAMLLNVAVKYVKDGKQLAEELRSVIRAPEDLEHGRQALTRYVEYLQTRISSKELTAINAGINRVPFFASVWWYVQRPEQWPIFYPTTRRVLSEEKLFAATGDGVADYIRFCGVHNALRTALGIDAFELEYLCIWLTRAESESVRLLIKKIG